MKGIFGGVSAGLLQFADGHVSFATVAGEAFNVPLEEIKEIKWPKLQMGFGFEATVAGQKYKITFMKPNGGADLDDGFWNTLTRVTSVGRGVDSLRTLSKAKESKKSAQEWRAVLGG